MQPPKYALYPSGPLSVARVDAFQYIANVSMPLTASIRQYIENYLTLYNRRMLTNRSSPITFLMFVFLCLENGLARIVYAEPIGLNQTLFYLVVNMRKLDRMLE